MTDQPQAPAETPDQTIARAQIIINKQRERMAEEVDHAIALDVQIQMLQEQLDQEKQVRSSLMTEISRLKSMLPGDGDEQ